jgi:nucleoside-diphosphate-sugar epimerase
MKKILITGGAGYVGSELVPYLLNLGHEITVLDLFIYGNTIQNHKKLNLVKADIRDINKLEKIIPGHDTIIHLACISNDPSFELNPKLGKEINLNAFEPLVQISKKSGIKKFIYASSSSVYGIKEEKYVNEDMKLEPLTDYSKVKADCEKIILSYLDDNFFVSIVRPATVCGFSRRQRLDLVLNILSNFAFFKKEISVFGGDQLRPNIHIKDMVRVYETLIDLDDNSMNGEIFNAGTENYSVNKLAEIVKAIIGPDVKIRKVDTNDNRSYHISSKKIKELIGFKTKYEIKDAVYDLKIAFQEKKLTNTFDNPDYFNIKKMQSIHLK